MKKKITVSEDFHSIRTGKWERKKGKGVEEEENRKTKVCSFNKFFEILIFSFCFLGRISSIDVDHTTFQNLNFWKMSCLRIVWLKYFLKY